MEQARRAIRLIDPPFPLHHLVGHRLTQIGSGTAAGTMPASPWLQTVDGTIDFRALMEGIAYFAALTGAPPASEVQASGLAINMMRPATVESETLLARARVLNSGPTFTLVEVLVEDGRGRAVAHGTASYVIRPLEPPPPPHTGAETPFRPPTYPTPDPWDRPLDWSPRDLMFGDMSLLDITRRMIAGEVSNLPLLELFGLRFIDVEEGADAVALHTTDWLAHRVREVAPAVLSTLAWTASGTAVASLAPPGYRLAVLDQTVNFLDQPPTDGRDLLARGAVTYRRGEFVLSMAEITDADGNVAAVGHQTSLLTPRRTRSTVTTDPARVLATVLFTDIVGSTEEAERLGDSAWQELLGEHHAVVRKQLQFFKGREIKTTGDGFLATFDSPGRAVQCARAIRDGIRRLGLEVRIGLHSGECEVSGGDVSGIAVHIASRVQGLAGPGEILVSGTIRDLVTGSGLRFEDRGRQRLKGIEGDWPVFTVVG